MTDKKILSLIPEALREDLINEVVQLLKERDAEEEKKNGKGKSATDKELEAVLKNLKI